MKFIIEHLDNELYEWSLIEYRHVSKIVGKESLIFTNIKKKDFRKLQDLGKVFGKNCAGTNIKNICVLSQYSEKTLEADDVKKFDSFIFGGILGDNPAKNKTAEIEEKLRQKGILFETRNLGKVQMPTDVAVYVAKKILEGKKFSDFKFVDNLEIEINENESVELNFRYAVDDNKVIISEELVEYLRRREEF